MTLSVNSATTALAALQALQTSANAAAGPTANPTAATAAPSAVNASVSAPSALFSIANGIGQALSAADAGVAAGQTVLGLLQQMRDAAGAAADPRTDASTRTSLHQGFRDSAASIGGALESAQVNGTNLVDGSIGSTLSIPLGEGATASLTPQDLSLGGPTLTLPADASIATATAAAASFQSLGDAIGSASLALATLQGQSDQISAHGGVVQALGQALASPGGDEADSARLLALQVSQQLSTTGEAIANQSPASVLSLFRS